jgi:hypothetical protein
MKGRNTTVLGILTLITAVSSAALAFLNGQPVDWPTTIASITAGIGLIKAADQTQ